MGLRGPKPKTKSRASIAARLKAIAPLAVDEIEKRLKSGEPLSEADHRLLQQAWRIIEQVDGRPRQQIDNKISGPVVLTIKRDGNA